MLLNLNIQSTVNNEPERNYYDRSDRGYESQKQ